MSTVTITDTESEVFYNIENVVEFLFGKFKAWPRGTKLLFEGEEQPLNTLAELYSLEGLYGSFEVVIEPQGLIAAVSAAALGAVAFRRSRSSSDNVAALTSTQQLAEVKSQDPQSLQSNNKISGQINETRTARRIPDIFGQVRAYPDLIFPGYVSGDQIIGVYCIGRGDYTVEDFMIGDTAAATIPGLNIEVYSPNTSPNNAEPHTRIGEEITDQLSLHKVIYRQADGTAYPVTSANKISISAKLEESGPEVTFNFVLTRVSDQTSQTFPGVIESGYTTLTIDNPYAGQETQTEFVRTGFNREADVYYTDEEYITILGFTPTVGPGLDGFRDANGNLPVKEVGGDIEQTVEEIEIAEIIPCTDEHFGNITLIYTKSETQFDGRLNCLATRNLPVLKEDLTFTNSEPTKDAASILVAMAIDPFIGRLNESNLNLQSFRTAVDQAIETFGDPRASYFSYTFDDVNLSFEDTASIVCEAVFCNISRIGSLLEMNFEQAQSVPVLLFNDYNKLPNSESRNLIFGNNKNYDGIRLEYFDQVSGEALTISVPLDLSANVEKSIKTIGIRTRFQAYFHAQREYQKLTNQDLTVTFDTTSEANLLKVDDLIVVSDSTLTVFESGEIAEFTENEITISNPVRLDKSSNYVVFIQSKTGSVIKRIVTQGLEKNKVQLATPIGESDLSVDINNFARAIYTIVEDSESKLDLFLVTEKSIKEGLVVSVKAVNYSDQYYSRDSDFIDGIFTDADDDQIQSFGATAPFFRYVTSGSLIFYVDNFERFVPDVNLEAYDINGDPIAYTFEGPDGNLFEVDDNFRLKFKNIPDRKNPTDHDSNNFYEFVVRISDGNLSRTVSFTATVVDAFNGSRFDNPNRPPLAPFFTNLTDGQVAPVQENIAVSFFTVIGYDVNGDTPNYFIVGGQDSSKFSLDMNTGALSFKDPPDFELPTDGDGDNVYEVRIRISDGTLFRDATLLVEVTDQDEGP